MAFNRLQVIRTKRQRQFLFGMIVSFCAIFAGLLSNRWWFISVPILILLAAFMVGRNITTRKISLRILKSLRPLILLFGVVILITSGSGRLNFVTAIVFVVSIVLAGVFSFLMRYELSAEPSTKVEHSLGIFSVFLISNVVSLSLAIWGWPIWLSIGMGWLGYYVLANFWLNGFVEKPERLALVWSLIAVEISLICSFWIIFYAIPKINIVVSQSSLILASFAYSIGGIYYHHHKKTLSRNLLLEYFGVTIVVFGVLLMLTRWIHTV